MCREYCAGVDVFLSLSLLLSGWFGFVCVCCDATGFSCG